MTAVRSSAGSARDPRLGVLRDALLEGRLDVAQTLIAEVAADRMEGAQPSYETMADGCDGDSAGLRAALGDGFLVLYENYDGGDWGHHSANAIFLTADGRIIHANCGGCSCGGSGDWSVEPDVANAWRLVPEQERT